MDQVGICRALFTDLSKFFHCLAHDFLLARLEAYCFTYESLKLINRYITDRKYRTKITSSYSSFLDLLIGVNQGSIHGPLIFNIVISGLFLFPDDNNIPIYADDATPYAIKENTFKVLKIRRLLFLIGFQLIIFKHTQRNLIFFSNGEVNLNLDDLSIKTSKSEKLLGINIDNFLTFNEHFSKLCKKAGEILHAIARISSHLNKNKLSLTMNAFFCPSLDIVHLSGFSTIQDITII